MSAEYVRRYDGVDFKRGDRVVLHDHFGCPTEDTDPNQCGDASWDEHGVVVSFPGQYVGVRFDKYERTLPCHPTWRLRKESS